MKKYPEYKQPDFANWATQIGQFWKENRIFQKSIETRAGQRDFVFYEGPPSANGTPGIHHVMARTVKDIFCRYKTLKGFRVNRKGGWDTHGLPVELQVEKLLGITKDDIGKTISVEDYNRHCREAVMKYTSQWNDMTEQMGYWVDLENPYITYESEYIETLWYLLKQLHNKDLLYKGYTIQPYSPAAGTGLSSHELNQPGTYRMVKDTSIVAQFQVIREEASEKVFSGDEQVYFLAWTTTPWTLPSNTALAVGENITYVKVRTFNPYTYQPISVILAADLVGSWFSDKGEGLDLASYNAGDKLIPWQRAENWKGSELVGIRYHQLMPYVQPDKPAFRVIAGDFVSTEDGTGIVHIAPTFGADDFRAAQKAGIPPIMVTGEDGKPAPLVDRRGRFVKEVTDYAGFFVKNYDDQDESDPAYRSTDVQIAIRLKEENKAFRVEKYEHSYPHCWRTDKPVLYYPMESWFIRTTAYKDRMAELNRTINWKPASTGTGRFGNWLENLVDWNLSRSRFWGTPLPIWRSEDSQEILCIGSIQELKDGLQRALESGKLSAEQAAFNQDYLQKLEDGTADLHRPFVDHAILMGDGGQLLTREPDLVDVWFDSGAMPYAQWHYPFGDTNTFDKNYPADFIAEGVDQTRGWFFTLHALAVMLFDSVAYKNVIANGLVLDKDGNKMSKRLGNVVDPFKLIAEMGPDATRWYMIGNSAPWDNLKFDVEGVKESQRRFFMTLFSTYNFFALYANLDEFRYEEANVPYTSLTESDRWILSRLNHLIQTTEDAFEEYEPTRAVRAIQDFVSDELSNWYVRLNRKRFWRGEYNEDKRAAYQTLYTCLATVAKLMAPVAPFFADKLFRDLNEVTGQDTAESVHLSAWPTVNAILIDQELEHRMELAQRLSSLIHSVRKKHNLKVRQPLARAMVPALTDEFRNRLAAVTELVLAETNIKELQIIENTAGVVTKRMKPNFKRLGKTLGPLIKELSATLEAVSQDDIIKLETTGQLHISIGGQDLLLTTEDVEIISQDIPGWVVASESGLTVALDTTLTEGLLAEGVARDVVNRLQNLRKDMGLEVQDKILVRYNSNQDPAIERALEMFKAYICQEVQAIDLYPALVIDGQLVELDDRSFTVLIEQAAVTRG